MKLLRKVGVTSEIWQIFIADSSSTTGAGLTGLVFNSAGLTAYYHRDTDTTATAITLVTMTVGTFTSSGFKEIDATNMPGWYQFCPPNAALASGAKSCAFHLKGATNMAPLPIEVDLQGDVNVTHWLGTAASTPTVAGVPNVNVKTWNDLTTVALPLVPTVAGRTLDVSAGGEAGIDWANVGTPGSTVALSATTVNAVTTTTTATNVTTVNGLAANVITAASIADGAIDRATFAADTGMQSVRSNTAQAGASGSITLDASASSTTDFYVGQWVYLTGGTGVGQSRVITAYNGTTKVATITPNWATNPDVTSTFAIYPAAAINLVNTITTYTGNTVQTGDSYARIGATGSGLTSLAQASSWTSTLATNLGTLASHDPGTTIGTSTLTQTQVTGGAYSLSSASFVCGDTRIANLDATVSSRSTLTQTQVTGGAYSVQSASCVLGDARIANLDTTVSSRGTSTLTQTQVTGGAYSIQSASCVLGDARIANLDAAVSTRGTSTLTQTQVTGGAYSLSSASFVCGDTRIANLDAAVSSRMATYTQPTGFLAATFPTTVASTTNITGGTITTATNVTNVNGIAAAALAQLFTVDSTKVFTDAVAGSVVSELANNVNVKKFKDASLNATPTDADGYPYVNTFRFLTTSSSVVDNLYANQYVQIGECQAAASTSLTLAAGASAVNDAYKGCWLHMRNGDAADSGPRYITAYNGTTKVATVSPAWAVTPTTGDKYRVIHGALIQGIYGDTVQTGDAYARLGAPAGASISADIAAVQADLPIRVTKNVALANFPFFMADSSDHVTGKTGLTITATRSLDGGAFASCTNSATEVGNGWYVISLSAADLNANTVALRFTGTGADSRNITIVTQPT